MKVVSASDARDWIDAAIEEAEAGATVVVTRDGAPVARLMPAATATASESTRRENVAKAFDALALLRRPETTATVDEILAWRHEGHER